ncbi:MAG: SBBP repeat-containing protein [bacterium]|nr:SBBP repeat-containing protein [bacterium]
MNKLSYLAVMTLIVFTSLLSLCSETQAIVHENWSQRYFSLNRGDDIVCGVATDSVGNIYVAGKYGHLDSGLDYALIKLASNGFQRWITYYDGGIDGPDIAVDFIRDHAGNFYLTGKSQGIDNVEIATVKYSAYGLLQWVARYPLDSWTEGGAVAMTLNDEGNVYVTGTCGAGVVTIMYNASGVQQWVAQVNISESEEIVVDDNGSVYVTGCCWPNYDFITIKYNPQGVQEWVNQYDGPGHGTDIPSSLNLDSQGNVYVTGTSYGTSTSGEDIAIIKYNSSGVLQWVVRYDTPNHADDYAADIKIDTDGNLVVVGWVEGSNVNLAYLTLKYTSEGVEQWSRIYQEGGPFCNLNGTRALLVDADRNIYVTGSVSATPISSINECLTLKYDSNGNQKWAARHIEAETSWGGGTWGRYMTLDQQNNVIVGGEFCFGGDILDHDFWVVKYQQTTSDLNVTMIPAITPIQIPAQGGSFSYSEQTVNPVVDNLRVDNWWKVIYPNQTTTRILGPIEDILHFGNQSTERSQRVPGYAPAGVYQYVMNIGEYPGVIWAADTLSFTKLGNGNGAGVDDWGILGSQGVQLNAPTQPVLLGVNPNPFNPATTIRFTLPEAGRVSLDVFDTNGRVVGVQHVEPLQAGEHGITFDGSGLAAGVYVYRLTTSGSGPEGMASQATPTIMCGKMVLVK